MATPRRLTAFHRAKSARKFTSNPSAVAAAAAPYETVILENGKPLNETSGTKESTLVAALCYKGMEITLASHDQYIDVILTRSRMRLQTLKVYGEILGLFANPVNGMVSVVTSTREVYNFHPVPTRPSGKSTNRRPVTVFGKYFWIKGRTVLCEGIFSNDVPFAIKDNASTVHIGSSIDYKLLVAHADQIAVFDISPSEQDDELMQEFENDEFDDEVESREGEILWTIRVRATILHAAIAGDGRSIAYVLQGEGIGVPYPFGVRTFVRDKEDGSSESLAKPPRPEGPTKSKSSELGRSGCITPPPIPNAKSSDSSPFQYPEFEKNNMGIVYKAGPFLVHSEAVTRISFRGKGLNHSSIYNDEASGNYLGLREGNDLLLTCCSSDGSFRVFSQGSWKMLFHWDTPPGSRADWVQGITMANLGDLDPLTKASMKSSTKNDITQSQSAKSASDLLTTPPRSKNSNNQTRNDASNSSGWQSQLTPNSAAGAWISEITFRGPYPAVRLSRLSFLKSGGDSWAPAHFDSVGTILPPATLLPQSVLNNLESMTLAVQGLWSAWNPWIAHPGSGGNVVEDESLSGNALALLGSVPHGHGVSATDVDSGAVFGGTHSPPAELRIICSHAQSNVGIIELPLWGDLELGALQLGSPLRYLLNLKENVPKDVSIIKDDGCREQDILAPLPVTVSTRCVCLEFESNRLLASVSDNRRNICLEWRKKGSMNIASCDSEENTVAMTRQDSDLSIATTVSLNSMDSHTSFKNPHDSDIKQFMDLSISPIPMNLPQLHLPAFANRDELISVVKWWPDENFGGPPRLFALTTKGTLILYEMPPPWSAIEPIVPDPLALNSVGSAFQSESGDRESSHSNIFDSSAKEIESVYEATLTPHPDFGLGLRLEAQADGMPAIAGSYKKHPLTGGRLPAERTGKIVLGDELIAVNGVSLEGLTFDEIIATVRDVSQSSKDGELIMRFRALEKNRMLRENLSNLSFDVPMDEGLEVVHQLSHDAAEQTSVIVGANGETQQEFGRIVATIPNAMPSFSSSPRSLELLPWHYGEGAPAPYEVRGATLLVVAVGRKINAFRFEVLNGSEADSCGKLADLGFIELEGDGDITSLVYVQVASDGWCINVCDSMGGSHLVFIDVIYNGDKLAAEFRSHLVIQNLNELNSSENSVEYLTHASSVDLIANMPFGGEAHEVSILSASPHFSFLNSKGESKQIQGNYAVTKIRHRSDAGGKNIPILDFRWVKSGSVDAFPQIVTFSESSAIVHIRQCDELTWVPVAEIFYPLTKETCGKRGIQKKLLNSSLSPADSNPHLLSALRNIVSATDERNLLLSDWHPESYLSLLCTDEDGVKAGLRTRIRGMMQWLVESLDPKDTMAMHWDSTCRLSSVPFTAFNTFDKDRPLVDEEEVKTEEANASFLMNQLSLKQNELTQEELQSKKIEDCIISALNNINEGEVEAGGNFSREFLATMTYAKTAKKTPEKGEEEEKGDSLPGPIKNLGFDELGCLLCLSKISANPPNFASLDKLAQFFALSTSIVRTIEEMKYDELAKDDEKTNDIASHSFLVKKVSSSNLNERKKKLPMSVADSASLAALLSDSQHALLESCRPKEKWTWEVARTLNLPFWLRSDEELTRISEEIAQQTFKDSMDVVEASLFYIITGNMKKLKTMAAADRKHTGKTFFQFVTKFDFNSERGKNAAEKNAFSLLRKRKYGPAAAFFLLSEPPMLTSALNIIATKMEDMALAFFVARLVAINRGKENTSNDSFGSGFSLRGFGGGGGFASSGPSVDELSKKVEESKYIEWTPKISLAAKKLLSSHGLSKKDCTNPSKCLQLLWLGRPNDAALAFLDINESAHDFSQIQNWNIPTSFRQCSAHGAKFKNPSSRLISKINSVCDFSARPMISAKLNIPVHVKWSVSLGTATALCRRGIEIPSILILSNKAFEEDRNEGSEDNSKQMTSSENNLNSVLTRNVTEATSTTDNMSSSIFDSFDVGPPSKPKPAPAAAAPASTAAASGEMSSSIFDSFDVGPPSKPKPAAAAPASGEMSSSIFDSFDVGPPSKPKPAPAAAAPASTAAASGEMSSSIFDSFDVGPPSKPKPAAAAPASGEMSSSIFDSFDVGPPSKPKPAPAAAAAAAPASGEMSSSIFDSFDVGPPSKPKPAAAAPASGEMSSSIFDSFDVGPPSKPKPAPAAAAPASGEMSSSIFDSFDVGPPSKPKPVVTSSASSSSIPSKNQEEEKEEVISDSIIENIQVPPLWLEWKDQIRTNCVARRLIREIARVIAPFLGDVSNIPMALFRRHVHPLISYGAAHVFQEKCDGETLLSILVDILDNLCSKFEVSKAAVIERSLLVIGCPHQPRRIVFAVLLNCLTGRADLAEDIMRDAANDQVQHCEALVDINDELVYHRKSLSHTSSQYARRLAASVSAQLELCLWLHRGGVFPMSGLALKETTVGVRIGYIIASWGRCHEALETLLKCDPDCSMDFERGRQLWSSMKMIVSQQPEEKSNEGTETTSGGWEFLVDCSREEATEMLKTRKCGSFILRPHHEDHGIFTLSFRTNMKPKVEAESTEGEENEETTSDEASPPSKSSTSDNSVQHAIIRLSDAGFKCGSFGPYSSLFRLLESVSASLPFDLLFNEPPAQGVIKEEGSQTSPNSIFLRKLALHSSTDHYRWNASTGKDPKFSQVNDGDDNDVNEEDVIALKRTESSFFMQTKQERDEFQYLKRFGIFSQLLVLTELRKQISAVVASRDEKLDVRSVWGDESKNNNMDESYFDGNSSEGFEEDGDLELDSIASRMIRPFLNWCRSVETSIVGDFLPLLEEISQRPASSMPVSLSASQTAIEAVPIEIGSSADCGDAIIRKMIQPKSGVEFRTLRVGEAGKSAVIVLFRKSQAVAWIVKSGAEQNENDATKRLHLMEKHRVIERVDLHQIAYEKQVDADQNAFVEDENDVRYRFVDPWEVEVLESKDAELRGASLGRQHYVPFTIGGVARSCEESQRRLGGLHLLSLWSTARGGVALTKALASVYPPWERDTGGDLQISRGVETYPSTYANCFRQHLYRNTLFRRLNLPQRFIAILQVEILDLKNLTAPGGSPSVTAYALLRLKRDASNAPLTHKARTLDSASTEPRKISKSSGPNAPASWGSVVRFRFPLPEDVNCDGVSFDSDREALFKGAPSVLQLSVYEKKFMTTSSLGGADVSLDGLSTNGQMEEWVPLQSSKDDITWFARLRLTLRFELMCLASQADENVSIDAQCPSAGLRKMRLLSRIGGAHEDANGVPRSISSPDIVSSYFEQMVS
ncbi:hypothetical protein CTEN210_06338 [Chaetoceros tenuissimus]|uniref:PDZ domain-containing protein n=1 Tax=Chaetoceros tenuissimus TaxID=426638 RepID=A0AAD3H428_9STRA|nr:hypothetical protein CTEN210_06338 [Chaetoceros tenuissimus]